MMWHVRHDLQSQINDTAIVMLNHLQNKRWLCASCAYHCSPHILFYCLCQWFSWYYIWQSKSFWVKWQCFTFSAKTEEKKRKLYKWDKIFESPSFKTGQSGHWRKKKNRKIWRLKCEHSVLKGSESEIVVRANLFIFGISMMLFT